MSFDNILESSSKYWISHFLHFLPPPTLTKKDILQIFIKPRKNNHLFTSNSPKHAYLVSMLSTVSVQRCEFQNQTNIKWSKQRSSTRRSVMRKFRLPHGRTVATKAAGFLFRVRDNDDDIFQGYANGDFDGLIMSDKFKWDHELEFIRSMQIAGKAVSILGMDSPDDFMPPTWIEIMQLKDAFISSGAKSVDYIHYEDDSFKIDI